MPEPAREFSITTSHVLDASLETLVMHARNGDRSAFEEICNVFMNPICAYLTHVTGSVSVGQDLANDVFLKVLKGLPKTNEHLHLHFRAWIYRIATNCAMDYFRSQKGVHTISLDDSEGDDLVSITSLNTAQGIHLLQNMSVAGPEVQFCDKELIIQALERISPQCRKCLYLYYFEDYKQSDIAELLGLSESTVRSNISRGREQFKQVYADLTREYDHKERGGSAS